MQRIFKSEYDDYIHKIDSYINAFAEEQNGLSFARNLTYDADRLLKKGEEAAEDLLGKINQIRGHLYKAKVY